MIRRADNLTKIVSTKRTRPKTPLHQTFLPSVQAEQKPTLGQKKDHFLKETAKQWLPTDNRTFMFSAVAIIYLIIAVIHYFQTTDPSMLTTLLAAVGVYVGAKEIAKEIKKGKGEGDDEHPPTK